MVLDKLINSMKLNPDEYDEYDETSSKHTKKTC